MTESPADISLWRDNFLFTNTNSAAAGTKAPVRAISPPKAFGATKTLGEFHDSIIYSL